MANRRRNSSAFQLPQNDTASQSTASSGSSPVYHGIRLRAGKWVSEIRENKSSRIWLGSYPTPEMAAAAYDVAALAIKARAAAARSPAYEYGSGSRTVGGTDTAPPPPPGPGVYVDDEAMFGMPNLLSDMAEGMLLSPPRIDSNPPDDGTYYSGGGNLWNY
ncbi:unnamed protein product [Lactuca virosa]|uniref:AP2/ERF domain-containing protein n=1 Tax=Lactuca virosa TaxID=75947 RepID=A0AAU9MTG1_9ASTR|nr:unnamed protein product [Lactuca virosa]